MNEDRRAHALSRRYPDPHHSPVRPLFKHIVKKTSSEYRTVSTFLLDDLCMMSNRAMREVEKKILDKKILVLALVFVVAVTLTIVAIYLAATS
jgi:hypothetical protein